MRYRIPRLRTLLASLIALLVLTPSCGTDLDRQSDASNVNLGVGTLPGTVGTIGGGGVSVTFRPDDLPDPVQNPGSTTGSPLGHSPVYGSQTGAGEETLVRSSSRTTSALEAGQVFKLLWIQMVPEGVTPTGDGQHYDFKEGDSVDLWVAYEVAANTPYVRRWIIDSAGLDYTEDYRTHTAGGEYHVKLNYVLPIGSAAVNSSFSFEAYYGTSRSASRVASSKDASVAVVTPGPGFQIIDITMVKDGELVDWTLTSNEFYEGDGIDLWIKYEVLSNQLTLDRHWVSDVLGLEQWDYALPTTKGVYDIKLDWIAPPGSATDSGVFQYDLTGLGVTKYSDPFPFAILLPDAIVNKTPPEITNFDAGENVWCGKMTVMTSHSVYPFNGGTVDGFVQNYNRRYSPVVDLFNVQSRHLLNLTDLIKDPAQKFKIIVVNSDLSFGARLSINKNYNGFDPQTYMAGQNYDDTALSALPTYSLGGVPGTTKLSKLQFSFSSNTEHDRMLVAAAPGAVRRNTPGPGGTYRNGAFLIQLVKVNGDGTAAYTTDRALSAGGLHGAATSGLLYEAAMFYCWGGPGNKQSPWPNYNPGADKKCQEYDPLTGPRILSRGTSLEQISALAGVTNSTYPSATGAYQMNWEDLQGSMDGDYNDLVNSLKSTEYYLPNGNLKQVTMYIKALARGNADSSEWQVNMNAAFPNGVAVTTVNQFFDDADGDLTNDQTHEFDGLWASNGGVALPVFQNARAALPDPATKTKTANVVSGSTYIEGDYSLIRIVFKGSGVHPDSHTAAPYSPELRVAPAKGTVYVFTPWLKKGDALFSNGMPSGGFVTPNPFPWALEGKGMGAVYSGWNAWVTWLGQPASAVAPAPAWYTQTPSANYFKRSLFN